MKTTKLLPLAAALAVTLPTSAMAEDLIDVYGKINLSLQNNDDGTTSETELQSNNSRFGVKGATELEHGLELFYLLEWKVEVTDLGGSDNFTSRNQYVGIRGAFGELMAGRRDTVLKSSQGKVDIFSDQSADIKALFEGENRTSDTLTYFTPKFGQFRGGVSYILSESDMVDDGVSLSLSYGDSGLKSSDFYLSAAVDSEVEGYDVVRFTGQTLFNKTKVGLMYQDQEAVDGTAEANGYVASVAHPIGRFTLKGQVQMMDFETGDDTSFAAGVDYKLGASTTVYGFYTGRDLETIDVDQSYVAIGLSHSF